MLDLSRLSFEPEEHIYRLNGRMLPAVTQIIGELERDGGVYVNRYSGAVVPAGAVEGARDYGATVHRLFQLFATGGDDRIAREKLSPELRRAYDTINMSFDAKGIVPIGSEVMLYHPDETYAGTVDLVARVGGQLTVIDLKGGTKPGGVGMQTAGYEPMVRAWLGLQPGGVIKRACLHLPKKGLHRWIPLEDPADYERFEERRVAHEHNR
jgi:hypothetical protein